MAWLQLICREAGGEATGTEAKKIRPKTFLGKEIAPLRPIFNLSRRDGSVHRASPTKIWFFVPLNNISRAYVES